MRVGASPGRSAAPITADGRTRPPGNRFEAPALVVGVAGVLALGVALRFFCRSDLWADEVLSVNIAKLPLGRIPSALRHDGAPPLYYFLLHGWMRAFGTDTASVRALSGAIGVVTLVPMWCVGRRLDIRRIRLGLAPEGSRTVAWSALLLLTLSPYAIRYSTEARMYALVMLGVTVGYLAISRALERSTFIRLGAVAVTTGGLLASHYWAFSLLGVTAALMVFIAVRGEPDLRRGAVAVVGAMAVGALTFVPWLPSFRFQLEHTATPWGAPVSPFGSWATTFKSFGGNAHLVGWVLVALVLLGLFARGVDARHVEIDLATRPGVRVEAAIAVATLALGLAAARISGTTFEGRYASVVFPLFVLIGAVGVAVFGDARVRIALLAGALVLGAWGGVSNAERNRTQAYQVVPILRNGAVAGDVVLFCPDSIGTDVVGHLPSDLRAISLPSFNTPERIDWVDYARRVRAIHPAAFADRVVRLAGSHAIWLVDTNNGTLADQQCAKVADELALRRPGRVRELQPDPYFFEHQGVYRYPATS